MRVYKVGPSACTRTHSGKSTWGVTYISCSSDISFEGDEKLTNICFLVEHTSQKRRVSFLKQTERHTQHHPTLTRPPHHPTFTRPPHHPTFTRPPHHPTFTRPPHHPTFTRPPHHPLLQPCSHLTSLLASRSKPHLSLLSISHLTTSSCPPAAAW